MQKCLTAAVGFVLLSVTAIANAAPPTAAELQATIEQLQKRVAGLEQKVTDQQGQQITRDETLQLIKEMQVDAAKRSDMPSWMENLKFYGDFRLRYEGQCYNWGHTGDARHKKPRNRFRFRLRFGFEKTWLDDQLKVGFRLASGENDDPTSTNQTFDNDFSKKDVWIDLAYAQYAPKQIKGLVITGGKMKNPLLLNNGFFMDSDVNPEGFYAQYNAKNLGNLEPFAGIGYFSVNERSSGHDAYLMAYQAGLIWKILNNVEWTVSSYYHDWESYAKSGAAARGNDSPLSQIPTFGVVGINNKLNLKVDVLGKSLPVSLFFDWAHNCKEEDTTPDYENANNAYATGIKVGTNKKKGDWSVGYAYAYIEANALPGYFVDSDFGFANRKGHKFGGAYNLLDNLTAALTVFYTNPIFTPTTTTNVGSEDTTVTVQADLVWKF